MVTAKIPRNTSPIKPELFLWNLLTRWEVWRSVVSGLIQQLNSHQGPQARSTIFAPPSSECWFLSLGLVPHGHKMATAIPGITASCNQAHGREAGRRTEWWGRIILLSFLLSMGRKNFPKSPSQNSSYIWLVRTGSHGPTLAAREAKKWVPQFSKLYSGRGAKKKGMTVALVTNTVYHSD